MTNKIGINYSLREAFNASGKYIATTISNNKVGLQEFVKKVASRTGRISEIDVLTVIKLVEEELIDTLSAGDTINLDSFFAVRPSITGNFDSKFAKFDPKKNKISINIIPSKKMVDKLNALSKTKCIVTERKTPQLKRVCDLRSRTCNSQITAGGMVRLEGSNLSFDNSADDEGIFIYSANGKKGIKINYHDVMGNKELRFIAPPDLQELGDKVYIEIKSRMKTKTMRQVISDYMLTVVSEE